MQAELATVVAVRQTSSDVADRKPLRPSQVPGTPHIEAVADDVDLIAFATPSGALGAVEQLITADPSLAAAAHVAELADPSRVDPSVAELVTSLARRAGPGEVLVTDVVAQLAGGSNRTFSPRGHTEVSSRLTRIHAVSHGVSPPAQPSTFGRAVELASLDWVIDELAVGSGTAVILEGEPGIGKTHLAAEAARRAASTGARVVRAAADELGHDRPGHLTEALATALAPLLSPGPELQPPTGSSGHRYLEEFTALIEEAAQQKPLLLVAEDLHWADDLSLRALTHLASRIAPITAALVVTFRPTPEPKLLRKLTTVLEDAGAEHHVLEPLDPEAVTSLVAARAGAAPGPRLRDRLVTTAGNPLFVIELLRSLDQDGDLDVAGGVVDIDREDHALPDRLRDIVLHRVHELPEATVDLLQRAALLGSTCELATLAAIMSRPASAVSNDLLPAVEARILARTGDVLEFRHDVIREAITAEVPPAVRREMHTAAGEAMARAGAPPLQVARQLALGAQPGDTRTVEWLERAADEARPLDPNAAAELLEEALALSPPGWDGVDRVECSMLGPLTTSGRVDEAIERAELILARPLAPGQREVATNGLVSALATRGDLERASDVAAAAAVHPNTQPYRALVLDCIATSMRLFVDGSIDELALVARKALESNGRRHPPAGGDELGCWARHALGWRALVDGRYADALADFDESSRLLGDLAISDHGFLVPHLNAATAAAYLDDFERFDDRRRAFMQRCSASGDASLLVLAHFGGAAEACVRGRWDDALTEVEVGLSLAADTGAHSMTVGLHAIAALVQIGRGKPDDADVHLASGFTLLASGGHLFGADLLVIGQSRRLEDQGARDDAAQLLVGLWDRAGRIALALQYRDFLPHVVRLAGPLLGRGRQAVLDVAAHAERNTPIPSTVATALRCRGLAGGDADLLMEAVAQHRQSTRRTEWAETCEEAATACFASGRAEEGRALVDEAVGIWDDAGATHHIARLDALGRAHGIRRRRSRPATATHGWEALSPKEIEVVDLVASGLSNPAIGDRLYISRRTVETHLSHVFTKLGVTNRAQLAALVVQRRTAPEAP